ncbi:MAG TPA: V-type ATP synthase subunit D [Rhabdochlamydiaceae bacterium]|nr:V-type ATP synthase subunit D [Rhabdochlamydiaceae bacterium]
MAELKYTKTELRGQQNRLSMLLKYLPTLQLKKALLQSEVNQSDIELEHLMIQFKTFERKLQHYAALFSDKEAYELFPASKIVEVKKKYENIAGVDIPIFEQIVFEKPAYSLFDTPVWLESALQGVHGFLTIREKKRVVREKKALLMKELKEVSIRVNLFEKVLIPKTETNIKRIRIFLGDMQLAAVSQAKVSKRKILQRKKARHEEETE